MANVNTEVGVKINVDGKGAVDSVGSIKKQLKEANLELIAMRDKFGETSAEAIASAKKIANLKDSIGDARAMSDAFNPDAKFKALGSAIQAVAGGFSAIQGAQALFGAESKDLEKTLVKVQGALALTQGINSILEAEDSFKNLKSVAIDSFNKIKGAIGATGIGLLVVALGTIYAYWDDIKGAVSGVSSEQKKLNAQAQTNVDLQNEKLKSIGDQDNVLKLQGKSEKDILQLKIAQIDATSLATEELIAQNEITTKQQVETAKRNKDLLVGILNFVEAPVRFIYENVTKGLNGIINLLNKVTGTKIEPISLDFIDKANDFLANQLFNPDKVQEEANKVKDENLKQLADLKNQRAGALLQIQAIDKADNDKKVEEAKKVAEELKKINEDYLQQIKDLKVENYLQSIKDEDTRAKEQLRLQYEAQQQEINQSIASQNIKNELLKQLQIKYNADVNAINDANALKLKEANAKALEDAQALADENYIYSLKTEQEKATARLEIEYQKRVAEIEALQISEFEKNSLLQQLQVKQQNELTDIEKKGSDERIKQSEAEKQAKITAYTEIGSLLGQLSDLVGKQTGVGKALALGQIAIDTALAISSLTKNSEANPTNAVTGGISGAIQFATGIIRILANIKKAKDLLTQAKTPSGGGGGGGSFSMPSASVSAPLPPQLGSTMLNQGQINQLSSATSRAFVLESDVSGNQERIRRLNRASRIN